MSFEHPELLLLTLLLLLMIFTNKQEELADSLEYSNIEFVDSLPVSKKTKWLWLPNILLLMTILMCIVSLAKPYIEKTIQSKQTKGIAFSLVIDRSSSMNIKTAYQGQNVSRLSVAQSVLQEFVLGNSSDLTGRQSDLISLISFAHYARILSPLTAAHNSIVYITNQIETPTLPEDDGTAIGDAVSLAAAQLTQYENNNQINDEITSKVVILLTDGENNSGEYSPELATALAKKWGVKIYTIYIGEPIDASTADKKTKSLWSLKAMAYQTGATFQTAADYDSLIHAYKEIDRLEKSSISTLSYKIKQPIYHYFIFIALATLTISILLNATWLRRTI